MQTCHIIGRREGGARKNFIKPSGKWARMGRRRSFCAVYRPWVGALVNWGLLRLTTCVHGMKGEEEQTKNPDWDLSFARNTRPKGEVSFAGARVSATS